MLNVIIPVEQIFFYSKKRGAINLATSADTLWFYWVTIFWGIAILIHALKIFILKEKFPGEEWEEKKIKEFMEKDGRE